MSTRSDNYVTEKHQSLKSHHQQGGRYFLYDPDSDETVNVSRLTAYAEHGKEVHGKDAHHEIPLLKIDAPRFIQPVTREEHTRYHQEGEGPVPVEVDGFPLLQVGR